MSEDKPFEWVEVNNIEQMRDFYLSRMEAIRIAARECGYAIGLHGSLIRDLDLIAVPWIDDYVDINILAKEIHMAACGLSSKVYQWGPKPVGRIACSFPICWTNFGYDTPNLGHIDLSVMLPSQNQKEIT